jgi:signal transduction histidine kinase
LLFVACGAALLAVTYLLVEHQYTKKGAALFIGGRATGEGNVVRVGGGTVPLPSGPTSVLPDLPTRAQVTVQAHAFSTAALNQLLINSGIALAIMAVLSIWLGWVIAGRALRPLRTITNAARDISASSLHRRLGLAGPNDEIKQLGNTFDDLLQRLETSFEAQRQFAANASHELRTPLTLERALIEVALADPGADPESLRATLTKLLANSEQQERLIEALLTLSRSQRGLERLERIDLEALAAEALDTLHTGGLVVTATLQPAWIRGDAQLLERLVANLLTNAVRYNIPHGRIDVRTETRGGLAVLTIENSGHEVPSDQLERLFQPFQTLDRERTNSAGGFGLGLSVVQAIATAHHATITARPRTGGGLHVEVAFEATAPS